MPLPRLPFLLRYQVHVLQGQQSETPAGTTGRACQRTKTVTNSQKSATQALPDTASLCVRLMPLDAPAADALEAEDTRTVVQQAVGQPARRSDHTYPTFWSRTRGKGRGRQSRR